MSNYTNPTGSFSDNTCQLAQTYLWINYLHFSPCVISRKTSFHIDPWYTDYWDFWDYWDRLPLLKNYIWYIFDYINIHLKKKTTNLSSRFQCNRVCNNKMCWSVYRLCVQNTFLVTTASEYHNYRLSSSDCNKGSWSFQGVLEIVQEQPMTQSTFSTATDGVLLNKIHLFASEVEVLVGCHVWTNDALLIKPAKFSTIEKLREVLKWTMRCEFFFPPNNCARSCISTLGLSWFPEQWNHT